MMSEKFLKKFNEDWKDTLMFKIAEKVEAKTTMNEGVKQVFDTELKRILCKMGDIDIKTLIVFKEMLEQQKEKLTSSLGRLTFLYVIAVATIYENIEEDKQRKKAISNLNILGKI